MSCVVNMVYESTDIDGNHSYCRNNASLGMYHIQPWFIHIYIGVCVLFLCKLRVNVHLYTSIDVASRRRVKLSGMWNRQHLMCRMLSKQIVRGWGRFELWWLRRQIDYLFVIFINYSSVLICSSFSLLYFFKIFTHLLLSYFI